MKKVNKKGQFEPIHAISILLCLLIAIVFFVLKRKLSNLNMQEANPQQNNFLKEAEERRKAKIEEEMRKKQEEDRLNKEKESGLKNENVLKEAKVSSFDLNSENPLIELNINEDKNIERIKNLDYDYFDNKATTLYKSNVIRERIIEEKKETVNLKNKVNISLYNVNNGFVSSNKLETNENQNPASSIVMKRIVLLDPEIKTRKDDNSLRSLDISNDTKNKFVDPNKSNDYASGRGIILKDNNILSDKNMKNQNINKTQRDLQKINVNKGSNNPNNDLLKNQKNNQDILNTLIPTNTNKKPAKALHLNHVEKEMFFTALAIGNAYNNSARTQKLISVESLYEIKLFVDNKIEKDDENFNKEFSDMLKSASNYEDYTKLIDKYSQSLKNQIIISRKNYAELVINSLKYKEINHAIFFICEMDIRHYKIPRILLMEYFNNFYFIEIFKEQMITNQKRQKYSESIYHETNTTSSTIILNNNPNYNINLISPQNSDFKKNSEYFFFSSKKENYKVENLYNILTSLDLNIEKINAFDINKQEINFEEENAALNKIGLFNSGIEENTNQNANPINKIQGEPAKSTISINTKDPPKKKNPKKKKTIIVTSELNKPSVPEKTVNPTHISGLLNQGEPNKTNQTIVQGKYTFYNPNPQPSREDKKILNDNNNKKSNHIGSNNFKNYDQNNKNKSYHNNHHFIDNNIGNQKLSNRGDNYENYKLHQINNQSKVPQNNQDGLNSNHEKLFNIANKRIDSMNNENFKQSNKPFENRNLKEPYTGNTIYNGNFIPLSRLRNMNIKEVKEFVPKNFVIINKESKD